MGNKTGKGARNGHVGKEKHMVKGNKALDGDCSRSEGVHTGNAELVKSKEKEMSFSAGTEKKNDYKAVMAVVKAGGESVRYNNKNSSHYFISKLRSICLFTIVGCSFPNARKCIMRCFRFWKCEINI